ncbi:phage tail tape measure protein [Lactobacillus crispatus]|uniref:phage tail tape measure protein n=1 Tax=Lactobacillus crispatus TaxID=47770 RepID=UPI0022B409FA|nr:phage tail tape measure protein [Lactobacillus crispatus]WAZ53627.1 phage tail tape measure protein [Lactobacillus crispatus]
MTDAHEGMSLSLKANFTQVNEAKKATQALNSAFGELQRRANSLHMSANFPREINHIDTVTASYVRRLESEGKTYEANQQKVKAYQGAIGKLSAEQSRLQSALNRTTSSTDKASDAYRSQQIKLNQTVAEINKFKAGIKSAQSEMERIHPTGFNRWVKGANEVTKATSTMKSKLHSAWDSIRGGATVAAAGIGAVGAAAFSGAKQSAAIQQRYREINNLAVLGGEKQKEVTKSVTEMQRQGRDMSIKYGKSQQEITAGYEDLVKRGYTTKQAIGALQTELQASVASGDKFSDVTTVSSQVLDAFGMRADSTSKMLKNTKNVVNELAYSADATSTGFSDLGVAMSYVGTAAHSNNISLAETASALGVLSNNGLESDKAGTALRATINGLTNQVNKIGSKNSIFTKLGIKKSEMVDAHGNLKGLSQDMAVLYKHIKEHSKGGSDQNGFFKSIFGTTGMNGAMILAKYSKEVEGLTKRTEKAGKTGTYVAELAKKNMGTAQGSAASAQQAMNAFKMTLGNAVLPAINEASNSLAKFLLSKDGEKFQKGVGKVVGDFANGLVSLIRFATRHETMMKFVGGGFLAGYATVKVAKAVSFVGGLYEQYKKLADISPKVAYIGKTTGQLTGTNTSFKNMTKGAKLAVGVSAVFNAAQIGNDFYQAATAKTATQRIQSAGAGIGGLVGAGIGGVLGGTVGATIGAQLGQAMGPDAAKSFVKAFNGHAAKYLVYGKKGSKSNGKYDSQAEKYNESGYYTLSDHKLKGKKLLYAYDDNGYYDLKTNKYHDQRSLAERSWGMNHRLNLKTLAHSNNAWDLLSGSASTIWNAAGHIADRDFWRRSGPEVKKETKGTWLDWSGFYKWIGNNPHLNPHGKPSDGMDRTRSLFRDIGKWAGKQNWDWGGFDPQKNGFNKWLAGFKPQVHGKKPQNSQLQLKASGILPKVNAKKWADGVVKDAQKGMKDFPSWTKQLSAKSNKWFKSKWNGMERWGGKTNKDVQKGWKGFTSWSGNLSHKSSKWFKSKWNGMKSWAGGVNKNVQSGWHGFTSWSGNLSHRSSKFFKSKWNGMQSWAGGINKDVQSGWKGIKTWFGNLGKNAVDLFKKPFEGLSKWVSDHTPKPVKAALGAVGKGVNWVKGKLTGKAHANGGLMHASHGALVGEAGPELAYKPYANNVRLLGANGPQFTKVYAGEHILNARDTAKVLNGGLGNGLTLKGYASGTDKLGKTSKKVTNDYKQIADKSSKSLNSLSKKSSSTWNKITRQTGKDSSKTRKRAISDYSDMHKGIVKQMDKTHDGVISLSESTAKGFGKALGKTKGFARDAMSDSIGEINKGITGIDKVLGQFGGNTSVIKPVKFATGTDANGRLTENTLAMVNDAQTGPRQEALVSDKNELFLPRGNNVTMMLPKGWGVLNGAQTQQVAKSAGVKHFAKGSGLSHSALRKLAEKAGANPAQSFKEMFLDKLKPSGSNLKRGSIGLAQNSSQHFGNSWSNAMWTVINNAIGGGDGKGGTREAFLRFAESTFSGVPYVMGAMSKAASDCSGMVAQALKHFGINAGRSTVDMQHSSALQYLGKSINRTIPGDLVIFGHGTGAAGHVGIVKNPRTGTMFNETPPKARVTRIADDMGMGYGFYRVKGLHNASTAKKTAKPATNLTALAKRELGPAALKWIKDKLGDEGSLGGNIGGEGVKRWAGTVKRVLGMLHLSTSDSMVARVLRQIQTESGGNPNARQPGSDPDGNGSGPALGLMQTKRATFEAFKRKGSGGIFNGPANIYAGLNYAKHRYGSSLSALGNGRGYAKGGRPKAHTPFIAGERGPELITADGPVKVDSHEQTKRKVSDLAQMFKFPKINRPTRSHSSAPVININLNGPIYGTREDAKRIAELVRREINKVLVNISDELGTDPSLY